MLMVIGAILSPSLTTPSAGKLSDFIPSDGMCGLSTEERLEALRNIQNAVPVANAGGVSVPECGPGPWLQIANFDSRDQSTECPSPWERISDFCRQMNTAAGCAVATFLTGVEYGKVCGRIIGFAAGTPDSFNAHGAATETDGISLIDGVTITHSSPIQHIWTLSASRDTAVGSEFTCPCNTAAPANSGAVGFAGANYFCDTTFDDQTVLWDGMCGPGIPASIADCCEFNDPPFFTATLPTRTSANVDVHLCRDEGRMDEDILVEFLELYVQ